MGHQLIAHTMKTEMTASGLSLIRADLEPSAIEAYQARQANLAVLLAAMHDRLAAHAERAGADPKNWGFAGDLSAIEARLTEAVEFLPPARRR